MKYLITILFLVFVLPAYVSAQIDFYPGYAVNTKGDTLKGYINFKKWEYNPKWISFKTEALGTPVKLTVNDISYFSVDIGYPLDFRKYEGAITTDNTNIYHILNGRDTSYRTDTVFLKVLRKGDNVVLYSYDDEIKTRYFVAASPSFQPVELIYRVYYNGNLAGGEGGRTVNENTYKKQLLLLAQKYGHADDNFQRLLEKYDYNQPDLAALVSKINGVPNTDASKSNYSPPKAKLAIMAVFFIVIAILVFSVKHH